MKTYKIYISIILIFSIHGCDDGNNDDNPDKRLSKSAQMIYDNLLVAYNNSCISCLKEVLDDWNRKYEPKSNIPDSIKDVYKVFKEIYSPWDLGRMSKSEWGDSIYSGISYYVIQTSIKYGFHYKEYVDENINLIDFRPSILVDTIKLLYLTDDYNSAINYFLGTDYILVGYDNKEENVIIVPELPPGESQLRVNYLRNYLHIFDGFWWHFKTHPEVKQISFTNNKDSAQVYFRIGYEGGEVFLAKEHNEWNIVNYRMTWIE